MTKEKNNKDSVAQPKGALSSQEEANELARELARETDSRMRPYDTHMLEIAFPDETLSDEPTPEELEIIQRVGACFRERDLDARRCAAPVVAEAFRVWAEQEGESEPPSDHPPLTPEERAELRAIRRTADRQDAGLFLVQSIEHDLAAQGVLGPDDYVDLKVDENGDYTAHIVRAGSNDEDRKDPKDER